MREIIRQCDDWLFEKILSGEKKFEIRLADEEYKDGDILILKEVDKNHNLTGREIRKKITFVLKTKDLNYWNKEDINKYGFVALSLE